MDSVLQNALKRREELQRELREVERFVSLYERFKSLQPQYTATGVDGESDGPVTPAHDLTVSEETVSECSDRPVLRGLNRLQLRPHILAVLQEAERPLTRGRLLQKLDQRGVQVGGKYDRSKNMGTIMWRLRDDFVNLPGLGYWPRKVPYPSGGYAPGSEGWDSEVTSDFDESQA